jgi:hypothetical protein
MQKYTKRSRQRLAHPTFLKRNRDISVQTSPETFSKARAEGMDRKVVGEFFRLGKEVAEGL